LHGIFVPEGKTLTIKGGGSLTARSNGLGAGIGGQCERTRRGRRGLRHGDLQEARVCLAKTFVVGLVAMVVGLYFVTDLAPHFTLAAADVFAKTGDKAVHFPAVVQRRPAI
jgi:hypothetical protein